MPRARLKQLAQDGATDGQLLRWSASNGVWEPFTSGASVFGNDYQTATALTRTTTNTTTLGGQTKVSLTTPALTGTYRVTWTCLIDVESTSQSLQLRLQNTTDVVTLGGVPVQWRPRNTAQRESVKFSDNVVFTGAAKTFELQFNKVSGAALCGCQAARIEIERVS